jgi:hypothetical protein
LIAIGGLANNKKGLNHANLATESLDRDWFTLIEFLMEPMVSGKTMVVRENTRHTFLEFYWLTITQSTGFSHQVLLRHAVTEKMFHTPVSLSSLPGCYEVSFADVTTPCHHD